MWLYMYPHFCHVLVRFFPFHNRRWIRLILVGAALFMLLPQLIIIAGNRKYHACMVVCLLICLFVGLTWMLFPNMMFY